MFAHRLHSCDSFLYIPCNSILHIPCDPPRTHHKGRDTNAPEIFGLVVKVNNATGLQQLARTEFDAKKENSDTSDTEEEESMSAMISLTLGKQTV